MLHTEQYDPKYGKLFYLSFTSVFTCCLFVTLLLLVLLALFRRTKTALALGSGCMIGVLLAAMLRMLFPFELPYTKSIFVVDVPISVYDILNSWLFDFKVWHLLCCIWLLGFLCLLCKSLYARCQYARQFKRLFALCPENVLTEQTLSEVYEVDCDGLRGLNKATIFCWKDAGGPFVMGILHPYIVLPEPKKADYTAEELRFILQHELMHIQEHDLVWKLLFDILCMIFWWNPVFKLAKKRLFSMLELRDDQKLTEKLSERQRKTYNSCIIKTAMRQIQKDEGFMLPFSKDDAEEVALRLHMIADNRRSIKRWRQVLCVISVMLVFLLSTSIIFEFPKSASALEKEIKETMEEDVTVMTEENTFLVRNGENFDVYLDGEYAMTVDSRLGFEEVPVYETVEEGKKAFKEMKACN